MPPVDIVERAALGTAIVYPDCAAELVDSVRPSDYASSVLRKVHALIAKMVRGGTSPTVATLAAGGVTMPVIEELSSVAGTPSALASICSEMRAAAVRRAAILHARELAAKLEEPGSDPTALIAAAVAGLQECASGNDELIHISSYIADWANECKRRAEGEDCKRLGIATGLTALNEILTSCGLPCGHMTLVCAQSSAGKTALANSAFALPAALAGHGVALFSLEDSGKSVAVRDIAVLADQVNQVLQRQEVTSASEFREAMAAGEQLAKTETWIFDRPIDVDSLCGKASRHVHEHGSSLLIVDFVQYVSAHLDRANKTEREEYILQSLATLARSLPECATVVLSQYRDIPPEQRPTDNDVRGAKAARHFAHTIIHIWDAPSDKGREVTDDRGRSVAVKRLLVTKQKNGRTAATDGIEVGWEKTRTRFCNIRSEVAR